MDAHGSRALYYAQAQSGPIGQMASGSLVGSVRTGPNRTRPLKYGFKRITGDIATGDSCSSEIVRPQWVYRSAQNENFDEFFNHFPKKFWFFGFCAVVLAGSCAYLLN